MVNEDLERASMAEKEVTMLKDQLAVKTDMMARNKQKLACLAQGTDCNA